MDFESPDVEKDFPGLYASETIGKSQERDVHYSDEEKVSKKELLIGKLKDKKDKKDKGYVAFEGESSDGEMDESKGKGKKSKASFKFPGKEKKEKTLKSKDSKEGLKSKESKESKKDVDRESKDAKKKKESKVKLGRKKKKQEHEKDEKPLFGVPLLTALELNPSHDGIELPAIVRECIDYIEEHGMTCEGIYRMSGVKSKVQQLRACYNRHEPVCLSEHGPHVVASLLKQFLRELPDPVLTSELSPKFEDAAGIKDETKRVEAIQRLIEQLPVPNRCLLSWVFVHMTNVIRLVSASIMGEGTYVPFGIWEPSHDLRAVMTGVELKGMVYCFWTIFLVLFQIEASLAEIPETYPSLGLRLHILKNRSLLKWHPLNLLVCLCS